MESEVRMGSGAVSRKTAKDSTTDEVVETYPNAEQTYTVRAKLKQKSNNNAYPDLIVKLFIYINVIEAHVAWNVLM